MTRDVSARAESYQFWQEQSRLNPQAQIEVFWRGQKRRVAVRLLQRNWILLREDPEDGFWVVTPPDNVFPLTWNGIFNARNLEEMAHEAIAGQTYRFAHLFFFSEEVAGHHLGVSRWPTGEGTCFMAEAGSQSARFSQILPIDPNSPKLSWLETRSQLITSLNDFTSDFYFAARWLFAWEDDRYRVIYPIYDELREVMQWILLCCPEIGEAQSKWHWRLNPAEPDQSALSNLDMPSLKPQLSAAFYRWQKLLCERTTASVPHELLARHQCIADFQQHKPAFALTIKVAPSGHERLEAALKLRAWFGLSE